MQLVCFSPKCLARGVCSREDQRLRARIQQVIATAEADYKNKLWPLHCPVAELPLARKQNVNSYQSCSNEDHPNILQVAWKSILTYLSPREMYNTAFLSRELMMCISVESVIVSAVMSGGKARRIVQDLALMMHDQSIYPPDALRLLRLVNAVRCELCLGVSVFYAQEFGLNVCWDCLEKKDKTNLVKMSDYGDRYKEKMKCLASYDRIHKYERDWKPVLGDDDFQERFLNQENRIDIPHHYITQFMSETYNEDRLHMWRGRLSLLTRPYFARTGQREGPVMTYIGMHRSVLAMLNHTPEWKMPASEELNNFLDLHFQSMERAPPRNAKQYTDFVQAYVKILDKADGRSYCRLWRRKTISSTSKSKSITVAIQNVEKLKAMLECPLVREQLQFEINKIYVTEHRRPDVPCLIFKSRKTTQFLCRYFSGHVKEMKHITLVKVSNDLIEMWERGSEFQ